MDRNTATELLNEWNELPEAPETSGVSHRLFTAVMSLLPDDIEVGGAAVVDGAPSVVAFNATSVFTVSVVEAAGGPSQICTKRLPLTPQAVVVQVIDNTSGESREGVNAHVREWEFRWPGGDGFTLKTIVKVYDGWNDAPLSGERFARTLSARLNWALPAAA